MAAFSLNHKAPWIFNDVRRENILTQLLITDRKSVLFVGERDFSFTVAFAALREFEKRGYSQDLLEDCLQQLTLQETFDWENITATRYEPLCRQEEHDCVACKPKPVLSEVKLQCVSSAADYAELKLKQNALRALIKTCKDSAASVTEEDNVLQQQLGSLQKYCEELLKNRKILQFISLLPGPPVFLYGIDALAIPAELSSGAAVIWFQCPWVSKRRTTPDHNTRTLVSGFLLNLADQIQPGVYVCIGITKQFPYIQDYYLEGLLGVGLAAIVNSTPVLKKYNFIGADDELVKKVLSFGYHHQTVYEDGDLHKKIIEDHVTLIFQRPDDIVNESP